MDRSFQVPVHIAGAEIVEFDVSRNNGMPKAAIRLIDLKVLSGSVLAHLLTKAPSISLRSG